MDNFYEIREDSNPKLIDIVSELRHHINIWGVSDNLLKHFNTDIETLGNVCEYCRGGMNVRKSIQDIDEIIDDYKIEE